MTTTDESHSLVYQLEVCPYCRHRARYAQRDRLSFGWFCGNHADKSSHPENFYGYLQDVDRIRVAEVQA
jgi:hypothetical protein